MRTATTGGRENVKYHSATAFLFLPDIENQTACLSVIFRMNPIKRQNSSQIQIW
jgi:hypothetical protein